MSQARITIDRDFTIADVPRRLFGSFVEHMGALRLHRHLTSRGTRRPTSAVSGRTCWRS